MTRFTRAVSRIALLVVASGALLSSGPTELRSQSAFRAISTPAEAEEAAPRIFELMFKDIPLTKAQAATAREVLRKSLVERVTIGFSPGSESCEKLHEVFRIGMTADSILESMVPRGKPLELYQKRMVKRRPIPPERINPSCK